jgi:DNA polymerase elongation subunit (family B)
LLFFSAFFKLVFDNVVQQKRREMSYTVANSVGQSGLTFQTRRATVHRKPDPLVYSLQKLCQIGDSVYAMGTTLDGGSVVNKLTHFYPTFLFPLLENWTMGFENLVEDDTERDDIILERAREFFKEVELLESIHDLVLVRRLRVVGFCNYETDLLLEVHCEGIFAFYRLTKVLRNGSHMLYHTDIPFTNQLLVQKPALSYQDWVSVNSSFQSGYVNLSTTEAGRRPFSTSTIYCTTPFDQLQCVPRTEAPRLLKAFVRIVAGSQVGIRCAELSARLPSSRAMCDRVFMIGITYVWQTSDTVRPREFLLTTCPVDQQAVESKLSSIQGPHSIDADRVWIRFQSEEDLLRGFVTNLLEMDPDDVFHYPDREETLTYLVNRMKLHEPGERTSMLKWERFQNEYVEVPRTQGQVVQLKTRNVFDMMAMMKKKFKGSAGEYDLYSMTLLKKVRHKDAKMQSLASGFLRDETLVSTCLRTGDTGLLALSLIQQLDLMVGMERDLSLRLECANLSRITDVDISRIVRGDEQVRVYSCIYRFCVKGQQYLNLDALAKKPLKYNIHQHPPTYVDPPEHPLNTEFRAKAQAALEEKKTFHRRRRQQEQDERLKVRIGLEEFGRRQAVRERALQKLAQKDEMDPESDSGEDEDEARTPCLKDEELAAADEKEGGNVVLPAPAFYADEEIATQDFNSLYPSIMIAFNLSYDTAVYDARYESVPGIVYVNVKINADETVRYALGREGTDLTAMSGKGCMPRLLRLLLDQRAAIRKEQKNITDKFFWTVKEMLQLGMKTVSNAVYGFLGVNRGGKLPVRSMLYSVTSLGRYLQKRCAHELATRYGVITVYGDTDSIFILVHLLDGSTLDERVARTMAHYQVPNIQSWEDVCRHYDRMQPGLKPEDRFDVRTFSPADQKHAILYVIFNKLADECTSFFPAPIKLGFEKMCKRVYMGQQKKYYFYLKYDEVNPSKKKSVEVTGMPCKKREWTPWTRAALNAVTEFISTDQLNQIEPFIRSHVEDLIQYRVPMSDLLVTKNVKKLSEYKSTASLSVQLAMRAQARLGCPLVPDTRLPFVIVRGKEPFFKRAMSSADVVRLRKDVDWMYYLTKQFYKPMKALLVYHPEVFDFDTFYADAVTRLELKLAGMVPLASLMAGLKRSTDGLDRTDEKGIRVCGEEGEEVNDMEK